MEEVASEAIEAVVWPRKVSWKDEVPASVQMMVCTSLTCPVVRGSSPNGQNSM